MNFCNHCGEKVTLKTIPGDHLPRFVCDACGIIHYQNPRIIVGCLGIWEDKVMLCRRSIEPQFGFWNVPGGFMENGESVEEGALRELWEEAHIRADAIGLHSIFSIPRINQVHIHFLVQLRDLNYSLTPESSEIRMFTEEEIPWDEIAFASSTFILRKYYEDNITGQRRVHVSEYHEFTH